MEISLILLTVIAKTPSTEEVNALYERLLQETESKSEPLENDIPNSNAVQAGRDY